MARRVWTQVGHLAAAAALLGVTGCGGSSGSTPAAGVEALTVADKVSVVDAKNEGAGAGKLLAKLAGVWAGAPAGSDYAKDLPSVYVHEKAADSFGMVNEILCMMAQTKYGEMVNKGEYKALVNEKACRGNDDVSNASSSQGTSSNAPEYMEWTVRSTRADHDADQIVEAWIHEKAEDDMPPMLIQAKVVIKEGSSAENPYGIFTMNFAGYPVIDGVQAVTPGFKGILKAERENGKVVLKFAEDGEGENTKIAMEKNGTTGGGRVWFDNEWEGLGEMLFSYNEDLFHRKDASGANEICLDRVNFETSAWRYGMYDATTGNRVNVNSGFPINTNANGTGKHGWVGYWGLWIPDGVTIENGDEVYRQNYNGGTSEAYTVVRVGGKLKKHTKETTTLSAIKNIPLETNDFSTGKMIRVIWNGTGLRKIAEADPNPDGPPVWTTMDVAYSTDNLPWGELNFWSQSLGGQVRIPLANCTRLESGNTRCDAPTGTTDIVYFVENIVYPGDTVPATLACYDNCPDISAGNVSGSGFGLSEAVEYTFNSNTDMVLKKGVTPLVQTAEGQQWGYNSGPLFDATLISNPAESPLKCDWTGPGDTPMICGWKAWSVLDEFYTWETGLQNWNQLTVLKNAQGTALKFDQPLRVEYTHVQTNSDKPDAKYNGTKFFLDYNGFGELHGIPGKCVDPSSGQTIACGNQTRWVPEFTIPEGSNGSYINKEGQTKLTKIKPLEMEQRMTKRDEVADCSGLPFGDYTLPTIDEWVSPALGTEPVVTAAPAVIGGVVQ